MVNVIRRKREEKIPVEELQKNHLAGPADEPIEDVAEALQEGKVVVVNEMPKVERIVFRNQRDPGHTLSFHYASASHPFKQYHLIDGHEYPLPIEVIRNLEQCRENIEKYRRNSEGLPQVYVAGYKNHFVCERV